MKKEKRITDFELATSATLKAMASKELGEREINFVGNTTSVSSKEIKLSKISNNNDNFSILKTRGESDEIAIRLKYHDTKLHSKLLPNSELASQIFSLAEEARLESLGAKKFDGVKLNLNKLVEHKYQTNLITPPGGDDKTSFVSALHLYLRESLSESKPPNNSKKVMELWNPWLKKRVGKIITQLNLTKNNQQLFATKMQELLSALKSEIGEIENNDSINNDEDTENSNDDEQNDDQDNASSGGNEDDQGDELESGLDDQNEVSGDEDETINMDGDAEDGDGDAEVDANSLSGKSFSENILKKYKVFTEIYDEIIHATDLCDTEELFRLRKSLDKQLESLQGAVSRLANKLQRKLQARQNRTWEFDLEEGMLDAAKLTRVVTQPLFPLSYKIEKQMKFRDTAVTLLIDNSGSMRGRPITIAAICADILARTLERCGVKVEILGFTTKAWKGGQSREKWIEDGKHNNPGRLNDLRHIIYKSADAPWRRAKNSLGLMLREGILKENIDGEALIWAHDRLLSRFEDRKILMVISDGAPVDDTTLSANSGNYLEQHLKSVISYIENKSSVELIAIGIGHDVTRYYKKAVTLTDAEHLAGAITEQLADLFDENI